MRARLKSTLLVFLLLLAAASDTLADSIRYEHDWRIPAGQRGIGFVGVEPDTTVVCIVSTSFRVHLPFCAVAAISISFPVTIAALSVYALRRRHTTG